MNKIIKHFRDLNFTVISTSHEHYVDYQIHDIVTYDESNNPMWGRSSLDLTPIHTNNLKESSIYLHGNIRWDGCSNWYFDEQDSIMLHGCGREELMRYSKIMTECWDWTKELCPNWDESVAK